jgi:cardiolipin synthase
VTPVVTPLLAQGGYPARVPGEDRRASPRHKLEGLRARLRRHGLVRRPKPIRSRMPVRGLRYLDGNRVELYDTGREGLAAMLAAIESAREHVHLETYILRGDGVGRRFIAALAGRARAGVAVRLLYDAVGSRGLSSEVLAPLTDAGGDVVEFNPLAYAIWRFVPRRRDHRKLLIVDGRIAFTGGLNIGDEYERGMGEGEPGWRDAHLRVEGPIVRDLAAVFLESWFRADGPDLAWYGLLAEDPEPRGSTRCAVLADGPVYRRRHMREMLIASLGNARERVLLESPYLAPGRRVLDALSAASRRGVEVDLLLAGRTDHPVLRRAARSILPRLLACGVRVYEYEKMMMHGKVAVFDDAWAVVGTSNLDRQSFEHSYEVNLVIDDAALPARLRQRFERDLEFSRRVDRDSLEARGWREWLGDRLAAQLLRFV